MHTFNLKKWLMLVLVVLLATFITIFAIGTLGSVAYAAATLTGSGTASDPYQVANSEELAKAITKDKPSGSDGVYIILTDDITTTDQIVTPQNSDNNIHIDLGGHTYTFDPGDNSTAMAISVYESMTITNGSFVTDENGVLLYTYNGGALTIQNVELKSSKSYAVVVSNDSTFTAINCSFFTANTYSTDSGNINTAGTTTLNYCNLKSEAVKSGYKLINKTDGTLMVNNSEYFTATKDYDGEYQDCYKNNPTTDHTPIRDGNCLTDDYCKCGYLSVNKENAHAFSNDCDSKCDNGDCQYTRTVGDHVYQYTCSTTCTICGYTRDVTHSATKLVTNEDNSTHNEVYTCCNVVKTANITCTATAVADCTVEEKCACGNLLKEKALNHDYSGACDDSCNRDDCTVTRVASGEHVHDNDCDTTCNVCGLTRTIEHTYEVYGNWCQLECTICHDANTNIRHRGGTATCLTQAECIDCHTLYGLLGLHDYTGYGSDETHHYVGCVLCGEMKPGAEKIKHFYIDGKCRTCDKPQVTKPKHHIIISGGTAYESTTANVIPGDWIPLRANAPADGKRFVGWSINGVIVSTESDYKYYPDGNATIEAVFEDIPQDTSPATPPETPPENYDEEEPSFFDKYKTIILIVGGVILAISAVTIVLIIKKK